MPLEAFDSAAVKRLLKRMGGSVENRTSMHLSRKGVQSLGKWLKLHWIGAAYLGSCLVCASFTGSFETEGKFH